MNHTLYYLLTGLENIVPYLSRDHGRNPRYWRRKWPAVFSSCFPKFQRSRPMSQNAAKTFIVTRSDGILLARYRDRDWYLTSDPARACRLSAADAQAVLQSIIPASERFLWTLQPIREKEGISC